MSEQEANIVDPESIAAFFESVALRAQDSEAVKKYLKIALENSLKKDVRFLKPLESLPDNSPEWLRRQWGKKIFHVFNPDQDLTQKVEHIRDWLQASIANDETWLKRQDEKGRPLKLLKIGSLEQALKEAKKHQEKQRQKHGAIAAVNSDFDAELKEDDIKIVMSFEDGYQIVQVLNKIAAARESFLMQHCLADGAYDEAWSKSIAEGGQQYIIYSLRDPKNQPHVTMEVEVSSGSVCQCVGKQNKSPHLKYLPYILSFVESRKLYLSDIVFPHHILKDGQLHEIQNLPDDFYVEGKVDITPYPNFVYPRNLHIKGAFKIDTLQRPFLDTSLKVEGIIIEHIQLDTDHYQLVKHKNGLGRLYSAGWYHKDFGLHRIGAPAFIDYSPRTGQIISEKWYYQGGLHNEHGPAVQSWDSVSGELIAEAWYLFDKKRPKEEVVKSKG